MTLEAADAFSSTLMLCDHRAKLLQHVVQLCVQPLEFPVVAQHDRGEDPHIVAQACNVAGQPL